MDLRLEAEGAPGAGSLEGSARLPPPRRGFSEESQKPVETREEEADQSQSQAPPMLPAGAGWRVAFVGGLGAGLVLVFASLL